MLQPDDAQFLALVDELRKRGAVEIAVNGYAVKFASVYVEPEVTVSKQESDEARRLSLNETEREELAALRAAKTRFEELGVD